MDTHKKGFTLVELLIVLAIIGVLTAIVTASTGLSRAKARDTRRINDMKEIQIGLALYFDVNKVYPSALSTLVAAGQKYLPSMPTDPGTGSSYEYAVAADYKKYCIGVKLEDAIPSDNVTCTVSTPGWTSNYRAQR